MRSPLNGTQLAIKRLNTILNKNTTMSTIPLSFEFLKRILRKN